MMPQNDKSIPDLAEYRKDPCAQLPLPHWKYRQHHLPQDVQVRHKKAPMPELALQEGTQVFFRLLHPMKEIPPTDTRFVPISLPLDAQALAEHITDCYVHEGIKVKPQQVMAWTREPVFCPQAWIKLTDFGGNVIASGIAQVDPVAREGILDWVQVAPDHQGKGLGSPLVRTLLFQLAPLVDFVTVSGNQHNVFNPEALYRRNGFVGDDLWVISRAQ